MFAGCLGAREGGGVPLHQPPPPAPPQPGGRHGQAGARATQQVDKNICNFEKIFTHAVTGRKVRTPGRNRAGYVVYLAYQLVESVTYSQVSRESKNKECP